jgi:hypothetical protein
MYSSAKEGEKMNRAAEDEFKRQKGYQKEANAVLQGSLAQATPAVQAQQQDIGQQRVQEAVAKTQAGVQNVTPTSVSGGPSEMVQKEAAQTGAAQGAQLGRYQGMDEYSLRQWINNMRAQQQLNVIANLARGSAGTLPFVINQARQSEEGTKTVGQGLGAAGSVLGAYGATRPRVTKVPSYNLSGVIPYGQSNLGV